VARLGNWDLAPAFAAGFGVAGFGNGETTTSEYEYAVPPFTLGILCDLGELGGFRDCRLSLSFVVSRRQLPIAKCQLPVFFA